MFCCSSPQSGMMIPNDKDQCPRHLLGHTKAQPESGKVILAALKGDAQAQDIVGPPASLSRRWKGPSRTNGWVG